MERLLKTGSKKTLETKLFVTLLKSRKEWFLVHFTFLSEREH